MICPREIPSAFTASVTNYLNLFEIINFTNNRTDLRSTDVNANNYITDCQDNSSNISLSLICLRILQFSQKVNRKRHVFVILL